MGIFKNKSQATFDNMSPNDTSKGVVGGLIFCNQTNDTLVWKYPYMDIKKGAVIKVHQNQKAVLFDCGKLVAVLEPGRDVVVNPNNIPYLGKFMNVAHGGETSYPLEVWFVNITVENTIKWGFGPSAGCKVADPDDPRMKYTVTGFGSYRFHICNPEAFLLKLVGTQHLSTVESIMDFFKDESIAIIASLVQEIATNEKLSPADLGGKRMMVQELVKQYFNEARKEQYGTEITSMMCVGFSSPEYDQYLSEMQQGKNLRAKYQEQGRFYDTERQYDIASKAVSNPGAGNVMGAAMGAGMGFNAGGAIGQMLGGIMGQNTAAQGPASITPPPIPNQGTLYHVAVGGQPTGPFSVHELMKKAADGSFTRNSLVWCPSMTNWAEASTINELCSIFMPTPSPIM